MAAVATPSVSPSTGTAVPVPQWKKDLIARLRNQNKKSEERLWIDHHPPHHQQSHHPHSRSSLGCAMSPENGFGKDSDSPGSSDSEDLHYGPGIVNRLRNKYLSLALRESNVRPTILRKATSLENLLDDDEGDDGKKEDIRMFNRRSGGNDGGNRYRSSNRRQEMKRARSVEVISRTNHEDEELTMTSSVTNKINNRQSLHEDMLIKSNEEKAVIIENTRSYKKPVSIENGTEDGGDKYSKRINRPKRIPPLLNEREKPPVDVVKHAKMIFEKRPETRTKQPQHTGLVAAKVNSFNSMIVKTKLATNSKLPWKSVNLVKPAPYGDVAAKVGSFNDIIVKTKVALKSAKPPIKTSKPVLNDKCKNNTHHHVRPVAKPVILSEEMVKPKSLELRSPRQEKKGFSSLPSPIPDVSRVDIKLPDGSDPRNNCMNSLCETPDLILTSSPIPKITSPTYRKRSTENFINEERNRSFLGHTEATNKFISPLLSPTKTAYTKPNTLNFNREDLDSLGIRMISPISQKNITKSSATSVFNFIHSQVDQRHLPSAKMNGTELKSPVSEPPKADMNGFGGSKMRVGVSAFEMEKNLKNGGMENGDKGDKGAVLIVEEQGKIIIVVDDKIIIEDVEKEKVVKKARSPVDLMSSQTKKPEIMIKDKEKLGYDVVGTKGNDGDKSWQHLGLSVEKTSTIFENLSKTGKNVPNSFEHVYKTNKSPSPSEEKSINVDTPRSPVIEELIIVDKSEELNEKSFVQDLLEFENVIDMSSSKIKIANGDDKVHKVDVIENAEKIAAVQNKSASDINSLVDLNVSEEKTVKIVLPKKTKPRQDEATCAVFNFTSRKDVPDYISNDTSRAPSRPVIPKPDEPGIKLLPDALLSNFKEIQEVWEEDELIRSLEARPPSPCDVTFVNDNILIDGKSSIIHSTSKRTKLKISFIDDADIYEYPSETSLLLEDSQSSPTLPQSPTLAGSAQVGHTIPTLSGSSLATYTPKNTEDFQLGVTKSFHEPVVTQQVDAINAKDPETDTLMEEIQKPVLFSSGSTSDILF